MIKFATFALAFILGILFFTSCVAVFGTFAWMLNGSWMALATAALGATLGACGFIAIMTIAR